MLADLSATDWTLLVVAAVLVGFAKTAVGGVGALAVVLCAAVIPAKPSTGVLLPLLIAGDLVAVSLYRRHGSGPTLLRLLPGVVPGLLLGALFLAHVDDTVMKAAIGLILLAMGGVQISQHIARDADPSDERRSVRPLWALGAGVVAGFATMTANAAGPVMTLYLIMAGLPMLEMLGTGAWFFLIVNLLKVPLSTSLDLISSPTLLIDVALVPAMLLGGLVGVITVRKFRQSQFELAALTLSMVAASLLVITA